MDTIERFLQDERGSHLFEYALGLIVGLAIVSLIIAFRDRIGEVFTAAKDELDW